MSNDKVTLTTPVGRMVLGSLYDAQDKDAEGNPLVVKTGVNAGKARVQYFFALAILKGAEQHWSQTAWGKLILETGQKAWPQGQWQHPTFAWKITDGDSTVPNKRGRKPCDREGFKGNWVINFSSEFAPSIWNSNGSQPITETGAVKLGYYIQVYGTVAGNGSAQQPGMFVNHSMVALAGYGEEIKLGPDAASVGFGGTLPPGATAVPVAALGIPAHTLSSAAPAVAAAQGIPAIPAGHPVAVTPHPAFLQPGAPPPPVPTAPPARVMLPKANGATYEAMVAAGWTDALLVQHGMMQA
jgi:hypothetical protein